jgi:hypothetical protein
MISGLAQVIGMKPTLRSFFSSAPALRHGLQRAEGDQRGDRRPGGRGTDGGKEFASLGILWEQRLHHRGLHHAAVQRIDVAGADCDVVLGLRGVLTAVAGGDRAVRVKRIVQCHGALPVEGLPCLQQTPCHPLKHADF